MDEAICNPGVTTRRDGPAAAELAGEVFTRRVITVVLALITALTFAFGFGNVWALGRSLGVPPFVAPLVGPAVDLSVAGLLISIRHLSMAGVPPDQLRPARVLLTACGAATLALNIAGPVTAGAYGRAAFDSVGPGLLIGWAETGPSMLRFLYARPGHPGAALAGSNALPVLGEAERPAEPTPVLNEPASGPDGPGQADTGRAGGARAAGLEELLAEARRIDDDHRLRHSRPVSAETLRKQMRIGSMRARSLVQQVRAPHTPGPRDAGPTASSPQPAGSVRRPADGSEKDRRRQAPAGELTVVASRPG